MDEGMHARRHSVAALAVSRDARRVSMTSQAEATVMPTRTSRVRRHCSTICIALVVARFTPAITVARAVPPEGVPLATAPAAAMFYLSAQFCPAQERCGSVAATFIVAPGETVR
jgi:hypothetical protein